MKKFALASGVVVSDHGYSRAEERGIAKNSNVLNVADRAWRNGKTINQYNGKQRTYLERKRCSYDPTVQLRVFGGALYIFSKDKVLITVYKLGPSFSGPSNRGPKPCRVWDGYDYPDASVVITVTETQTIQYSFLSLIMIDIFHLQKGLIVLTKGFCGENMPLCVGVFLKRKLRECGMTQEDFAEQFGVDSRTVRRWISSGVHSLDVVVELADFFGVSFWDVFFDQEDIPLLFLKYNIRRIGQKMSCSFFIQLIQYACKKKYERW